MSSQAHIATLMQKKMIKILNESQMRISKCENIFAKSYTSLKKFL